jgi:hypothetical protein
MRVQGWWLGPELVWIVLLALAQALPVLNRPPTEAGNRWMMRLGWAWMTLGMALPFALWPFVSYGKGWLLLRIAIAGAVGGLWSSFVWCGAVDYKDSRNSGLLALWTLYVMAGAATLLAGLIAGAVVAFVF